MFVAAAISRADPNAYWLGKLRRVIAEWHAAIRERVVTISDLIALAELEIRRRAAATLGDQLIQQADQRKETRHAGGQGQRPSSEEPT